MRETSQHMLRQRGVMLTLGRSIVLRVLSAPASSTLPVTLTPDQLADPHGAVAILSAGSPPSPVSKEPSAAY